MKPTKNRLLIKLDAEEPAKEGEVVKGNATMTGVVVKAGPEATLLVGDRVIFSPYGFDEVTLDGEKYVVIQQDFILLFQDAEV